MNLMLQIWNLCIKAFIYKFQICKIILQYFLGLFQIQQILARLAYTLSIVKTELSYSPVLSAVLNYVLVMLKNAAVAMCGRICFLTLNSLDYLNSTKKVIKKYL